MTDDTHLDLTSHSLPADKTADLLRLFPEIRTEGGSIDFDKLKLVLGETVDVGRERYGMTWPGKAECFKTIQAPSMGTLLPAPSESVDFDTTENLIIEGDNLEALKLLQKAYLGKVKMIYIDPPYNTGNDFIYPDNYTESLQTYLEYTKQVDAEGRKFGTNSDTDGRFHSRWLNMMYPRLYLARNLLQDDGLVFISIDDNEVQNLRGILNDVFGEENFVETFIWRSRLGKGSTSKGTARLHEYIVCYAKNIATLNLLTDSRVTEKISKERIRQWGQGDRREDRPTMYYSVSSKEFGEVYPKKPDGTDGRWRVSKDGFERLQNDDLVIFEKQDDGRVEAYRIIPEGTETETAQDSILASDKVKTTAHGSKELSELFETKPFDYPKPTTMIKHFIEIVNDQSALILDFFAGSGTTAHATLELNKEDNGNRKFILVQLPEPTDRKEFPTIADITKERVRRVIQKMDDEESGQLPFTNHPQDRGFRVFKLAESNFKTWDASAPKDGKALEKQLELHIEHVREGRTSEDILYEILLKSGFSLTTPVEKIELAGKAVYSVASGGMMICLEKELTLEAIRAMAEMKPQRVVCLDLGFAGNDQLKTNAVQIFKNKEIVFKTV